MIIAVSHQKGGVGKSTIAYNLAVELSKKYTVNVVDLDIQQTITACNIIRHKFKQKKLNVLHFLKKKDFINYLNNEDENVITIIDTGGFDSGLNRLAMYGADMIITPVSTEFLEIIGLEKYKKILKNHLYAKDIYEYLEFYLDALELDNKPSRLFDGLRVQAIHNTLRPSDFEIEEEDLDSLDRTMEMIDKLEKYTYKELV